MQYNTTALHCPSMSCSWLAGVAISARVCIRTLQVYRCIVMRCCYIEFKRFRAGCQISKGCNPSSSTVTQKISFCSGGCWAAVWALEGSEFSVHSTAPNPRGHAQGLLGGFSNLIEVMRGEGSPPSAVRAVVHGALCQLDAELLNQLLVRRDCCSLSAVKILQVRIGPLTRECSDLLSFRR